MVFLLRHPTHPDVRVIGGVTRHRYYGAGLGVEHHNRTRVCSTPSFTVVGLPCARCHDLSFKRLFSKDFREAEKEFYREEGAQRAFTEAQGKFGVVYASAQNSMHSVNIDAEAQLKKLDAIIQDKQTANAEDLTRFFNQAREALQTHQSVLDFEPTEVPQAPKVQP